MSVKDKVVGALQSKDLKWHAEFERAIDRLTAFGMSDPLGCALWRFKYLNDKSAYQRALYLLAYKAKVRLRSKDVDYVIALAKGVMREWAIDACGKCNATGFVTEANGVQTKCSKCDGTGVKRHSDEERARYCALSVWNAGHNRNFEEVLICLTGATAATGGRVRDLLKEEM